MGEAFPKWQVLSSISTVPFCELTFVSGLYLCVHTHVLVRRECAELLGGGGGGASLGFGI